MPGKAPRPKTTPVMFYEGSFWGSGVHPLTRTALTRGIHLVELKSLDPQERAGGDAQRGVMMKPTLALAVRANRYFLLGKDEHPTRWSDLPVAHA